MSYVAAEPGVLISPTDDLQSPRSAPAAHDENADGITGGTRDDSAPNSRFQLGRRIPEATAQEGFLVRPFTQQCQIIHTEGDHAVIGVSPITVTSPASAYGISGFGVSRILIVWTSSTPMSMSPRVTKR
ncbi:Uncharacterised protein [Mycobacterium tuberculosis]|nr:Uncharacterised protein [Mycobacterium tuberculosis]